VDAVSRFWSEHVELWIDGASLAAGTRALWVGSNEYGPPVGILFCIATEGRDPLLDCVTSAIDDLEGVVSASADTWLLVANSSYGNSRDASRRLVAFTRRPDGLRLDALDLGGLAGDGAACERHPGYCVETTANVVSARLLTPNCIERTPLTHWRATHVRMGDRWIDEVIDRDEPCADRFDLVDGRFARSECGPARTLPVCAEPDLRATESVSEPR
jgi:hypothetical protein